MFRWRPSEFGAAIPRESLAPAPAPQASQASTPPINTAETRRAAQIDLFAGIGKATERNLALATILRDAFALVHEMAAFSSDFDVTAETTRTRADEFVASVCNLQSQSDLIEERLATAQDVVRQAHDRSRSALVSVDDLTGAIGDVERVVGMIANIAAQTNLLALNATIEAARAGAAGAGFRVVASEVKALSQQTERATRDIAASVKRIRERALVNMTDVKDFDDVIGSLQGVFTEVGAAIEAQGDQTRQIGLGSEEVATLAQIVRKNASRLQQLGGTVKDMTGTAEAAIEEARMAFAQLADRAVIVLRHGGKEKQGAYRWPVVLPATVFLRGSSYKIRVIDLSANAMQLEKGDEFPPWSLGETVDVEVEQIGHVSLRLLAPTVSGFEAAVMNPSAKLRERIAEKSEALRRRYEPFIARVQDVAANVAKAIESALASGHLTEDVLFDTNYRRDGDTEPAQYMTAAVEPLEIITRALLERELGIEPAPDFCLLQDRNGFNPVHNLRYSKPPRAGDTVWNLRHSRMRRIFDDRVGMSASRNLWPFIVHSYARDMGDAIETRMEFDAPVFINGRHWGAVRMAYQLASGAFVSAAEIA